MSTSNLDIKIPVIKQPKFYVLMSNNKVIKEQFAGYEMKATGFATRDGVPNILLDPNSQWHKIFEQLYFIQGSSQELDLDRYDIPEMIQDAIGKWEGFVTSFIWRKIKFQDIFVQLIAGQQYYLPKVLIQQIKDKINVKLQKIDPKKIANEDSFTKTDWNSQPPNTTSWNKENLDFYGKIK